MMIRFIIVAILISIFLVPVILYDKRPVEYNLKCSLKGRTVTQGQGYFIVHNILSDRCKSELTELFYEEASKNKRLNETKELAFYTDRTFLNELSDLFGERLYPVNSLDLQRCWLRYYYEGMKVNYYENWHHDKKRYGNGVKQYRLVIPVYDTSDTTFYFEDRSIPFVENTGVLIEAGNCVHKVTFSKGERLVLIMDFTTEPCDSVSGHFMCRSFSGYFWWYADVLWRNVSNALYSS